MTAYCYGVIYSYDNMGNLLSLSREGDIVGPFVVNDVSGGSEEMWSLLGRLHLPYIAMHTRGTPKNMQSLTDYDNVTEAVREFFEGIAAEADRHGVKDWILDPGFGFAKTVEQNWQLLREMAVLQEFGKEILVGLSRKSFLFRPLGITPADALPASISVGSKGLHDLCVPSCFSRFSTASCPACCPQPLTVVTGGSWISACMVPS